MVKGNNALSKIFTALNSGLAVPLLGAGISRDAPSRLPLAWDLIVPIREQLYQAVEHVQTTGRMPINMDVCLQAINKAPLESLVDAMQTSYGISAIDYLTEILTIDEYNDNHFALAKIAKLGKLPWIITLNFDLLIETALSKLNLSSRTYSPINYFELSQKRTTSYATQILKPHGTLTNSSLERNNPKALATTLSILGQEPHPKVLDSFFQIFSVCPCLIVGGYAAGDWDIFPILREAALNGKLKQIIWIKHPSRVKRSETEVQDWIESIKNICDTTLIEMDFTEVLSYCLKRFGEKLFLSPKINSQVRKPNAEKHFPEIYRNVFATVCLLEIMGEVKTAMDLMNWINDQKPPFKSKEWEFRFYRKLSFLNHLKGNVNESIRIYKKVFNREKELPSSLSDEIAQAHVWFEYENLSLLKASRVLGVGSIGKILQMWRVARKQPEIAIKKADDKAVRILVASLARYFYADYWLSWINVLMIFGPHIRPIIFKLEKYVEHLFIKIERRDPDFFVGGYWGLRRIESQLLSGGKVQFDELLRQLEIRQFFYERTQSLVERGNGFAYKALILHMSGEEDSIILDNLSKAEKVWASQTPPNVEGLMRVILFGRYIGYISFRKALVKIFRIIKRKQSLNIFI